MFLLGRIITEGSSRFLSPWINCVYVLGWYSTFRSLVSTLTVGAVKFFPMLNMLYNTRGIVLTHFFSTSASVIGPLLYTSTIRAKFSLLRPKFVKFISAILHI